MSSRGSPRPASPPRPPRHARSTWPTPPRLRRLARAAALPAALALLAGTLAVPRPLAADGPVGPPTPEPAPLPVPVSVALVGTLLPDVSNGACEAWDARCPATALVSLADGVWATRLTVPAGAWRWRIALDGDAALSYATGSRTDGPDRVLQLAAQREVTFVFDESTRSVADSVADPLAFAVSAGDDTTFACPPATVVPAVEPCLANLLTDPDGDGVATVARRAQPGAHRISVAFAGEGDGAAGPPLEPLRLETAADGEVVTVAFDTPPRTVQAWAGDGRPAADGRLDPLGFGHDSRDGAYRAPAGAVPAGTPVRLRFRTLAGDATSVILRTYDTLMRRETMVEMTVEAAGIACGDAVVEARAACDWWVATVNPPTPTTLTYRFIVEDGAARRHYADDAPLDGGRGAVTRTAVDSGWTITVHVPGFEPVPWLAGAVVYQVFPDRLANGDSANDLAGSPLASPADARYGWPQDEADRSVARDWTADLPETPGRGRDWFGGDLAGIEGQLDRLAELGVEVLYLNPVFAAGSNHGYDTRDYRAIDPRFGTAADWRSLVTAARAKGIRVVLDGVFNHVSADSPWFDRYGRFDGPPGACEALDSPHRDWFVFSPQADGPCAGPGGRNTMGYEAWSGYASLLVLRKDVAGVRDLVYAAGDAVAREWLRAGASGWRLDVMMDPSFGADFWPAFRAAVKATDPEAAIVGELWTRDQVLPQVRGDTADTTMDYRFRNAVTGYLGTIDREGFPDAGQSDQPPSTFAAKILSSREDYPAAVSATALSLLDSHDTERILWSLTPGETAADRVSEANLAVGKARLRLASLLQLTLPGAPTIYYGDEVGMTGADDPDNRRPFMPVAGSPGRGWATVRDDPAAWAPVRDGYPDRAVWDWYTRLVAARKANPVLRDGALRFLLVDDRQRALAYSRFGPDGAAAIVVLNPEREAAERLVVPMGDARGAAVPLPDGTRVRDATGTLAGELVVAGGALQVDLPALSGAMLVPVPGQDLAPPAIPGAPVASGAADGSVAVSWDAVDGAATYRLWRSPLAGGPRRMVTAVEAGSAGWRDQPGPGTWHYLLQAVDGAGNASDLSVEGSVDVVAPPAAPASPGGASAGPGGMTAAPGSGPGSPAAVEPGAAVLLIVVVLGILALLAGAVAAGRARRGGS